MHDEARAGFEWAIASSATDTTGTVVLDLGGQEINGNCHDLFTDATIRTLDLENADIIADARSWEPDQTYDVVMSTELLEHVDNWQAVIRTARNALKDGGVLLLTCASTGRRPHGACGAPRPARGEHYQNVSPSDLAQELGRYFTLFGIKYQKNPGDVYAWARA